MNAFVDVGWSLLVDVTLKSTVLLSAMAVVLAAWRPRNSAVAHRVWTLALAAMLAMPALVCIAPSVSLPPGVYPRLQPERAIPSGVPTARRGHVAE